MDQPRRIPRRAGTAAWRPRIQLLVWLLVAMAAASCAPVRDGTPAPTFQLVNQHGQLTRLDELRGRTVEAGTELYAAQLNRAGKTLNDVDMPLAVQVYVAPTDEEAQRDALPNVHWFYRHLAGFLPGAPGRPRPERGNEQYPDRPEAVAGAAAENPWEWGACYGSPETVLASMQAYSSRAFTNHWLAWMRIGQLEHAKVMRSMELFARDVMPGLKRGAKQAAALATR